MRRSDTYEIKGIPEDRQIKTVSVCMPVYNVGEYIRRSLDSVITQSYKNLQIIVVDDGSTDSTGRICDEYAAADKRIEVTHKPNGGIYTARNACLSAARGDYICWLDGDDSYRPDMIESLMYALEREDADICVCRYRQVFEEGIYDNSTGEAYIFDGLELMEQFLLEDERILIQNAVWNKLYKREIAEGLSFPDKWYEDMVYTLRLIGRSVRSVYLDTAYYDYTRDRAESATNAGINPHTYTDLIPNLFDRSAYLESLGRHDLALIADYMLYKRLLLLVTLVYRSDDRYKKEHLRLLDEHIRSGSERFDEIYGIKSANPKEYKKMKIYLRSPAIYHVTMRLNDSVVIPAKQRRLARKDKHSNGEE